MTRRRLRFFAIQALVVCVLGAIVVLTLLRPESEMPLTGVSGPGTTTTVVEDGTGGAEPPGGQNTGVNHGGDGGNAAGDANGGGGQAIAPTGVAAVPPAVTTPPPIAGTTPSTGGVDGGSPSDDQYADTLSRLQADLN